jgi:hypothetical protein
MFITLTQNNQSPKICLYSLLHIHIIISRTITHKPINITFLGIPGFLPLLQVFSGSFGFLPVSPGAITALGRVLRVVCSLAEPADVVVSAVGDGVHGVDVEVVREDKIVRMLMSSQCLLVVN